MSGGDRVVSKSLTLCLPLTASIFYSGKDHPSYLMALETTSTSLSIPALNLTRTRSHLGMDLWGY